MHSVFFSVAHEDIALAEAIWSRFAAGDIYLYTKTGKIGAKFWPEIEQEIASSRSFVVFWSKWFIQKQGTRSELKYALKLFMNGQIDNVIILRIDATGLFCDTKERDKGVIETYNSLQPFLATFRTSEPNVTEEVAYHLIDEMLLERIPAAPPKLIRTDLMDELKARLRKDDNRGYRPMGWIWGLNGTGRQTLVHDTFATIDQNARPVEVDISEVSTPKDILLHLESRGLRTGDNQLRSLAGAEDADDPARLAETLRAIQERGRYVLLQQRRLRDDGAPLPDWLLKVASDLQPTNKPYGFVVSQQPLPRQLAAAASQAIPEFRVPTLDAYASEQYIWDLVNAFAHGQPGWTKELVADIADKTGGTLDLMIKVVREASREPELHRLQEILRRQSDRFSETISRYVEWAFSQVKDRDEEAVALLILTDLPSCTADDLRILLDTDRPISEILGRLQEVGLVSRSSDGLYSLSSLLSHRLSKHLIQARWIARRNDALKRFSTSEMTAGNPEHGYIRIESRVSAALIGSPEAIPDSLKDFVTVGQRLRAGIMLYDRRHYEDAMIHLRQAFYNGKPFSRQARNESARYFGLAAIKLGQFDDAQKAVGFLDNGNLAGPEGKPLADFLKGAIYEANHRYREAIPFYRNAFSAAKSSGQNKRLGHVARPLIKCMLRQQTPFYDQVEDIAFQAKEADRTIFSLKNYATVLLHRYLRDSFNSDHTRKELWQDYLAAVEEVRRDPGGLVAYHELMADEALLAENNIEKALGWISAAMKLEPARHLELRLRRWQLVAQLGDMKESEAARREMEKAKLNGHFRSIGARNWRQVAGVYATILKSLGVLENNTLGQFASVLPIADRAAIVRRLNKQDAELFWDGSLED